MFVENKKVIRVGNSLAVTVNPNATPNLEHGELVKVTYKNNKIIIERSTKWIQQVTIQK